MIDALPPTVFVMFGARTAIANGFSHIEEQVKGIERAVGENPGLAFDLAKTLVESACRSILSERGVPFSPTDDVPRLFKTATNQLSFLPASESAESAVRQSLLQTLSGLSAAVQGVCELRNLCGFASHGSEAERPAMESTQAILAATAADAIVGFLHRVHRQNSPSVAAPRLRYEACGQFNASVDELHQRVRIFDEEFAASKVLFEMAPEPYRLYLAEFELDAEAESGG